MKIPKGAGCGILAAIGKTVLQRGRRAMRQARVAIETGEAFGTAGRAETDQRGQASSQRQGKQDDADDAPPAWQFEPQAEEGPHEEQTTQHKDCGEDGPQMFPGDGQACAVCQFVQAGPGSPGGRRMIRHSGSPMPHDRT